MVLVNSIILVYEITWSLAVTGIKHGKYCKAHSIEPRHLPDYSSSLTLQEIETGMEVVENILKDHHI